MHDENSNKENKIRLLFSQIPLRIYRSGNSPNGNPKIGYRERIGTKLGSIERQNQDLKEGRIDRRDGRRIEDQIEGRRKGIEIVKRGGRRKVEKLGLGVFFLGLV